MAELASRGSEGGVAAEEPRPGVNGERETDILEDEDEAAGAAPDPRRSLSSERDYSTRSWVQQQQLDLNGEGRAEVDGGPRSSAPHQEGEQQQQQEEEEELASLTTDIDESIEQLNQLILDLDPTFVPVPTRCSPLTRSASLHTNGLSHKGATHLSGWRQQQKQMSDVTDYAERRAAPSYSARSSPQRLHLHQTLGADQQGLMDGGEAAPPTPAFPVSPPTPYVKHFWEANQLRTGGQWQQLGLVQDSRGFLDSVNHGGGSAEGELRDRMFGSMCSVSSGSPLPHTDSSTPPPGWHDRMTPNSQNSPLPQHASPTLALSSPNAHSSPRGSRATGAGLPRETADASHLSSLLLGNGSLEHSLLEAMEGLGGLGGVTGVSAAGLSLPPLLPEKRGGGVASRSPSLSGFSSPHSGSSLSIPFSPAMTPDPLRAAGGASSPAADYGGKQDTVKFVQDTSKFWYKPDISRDQAIAVLKDKEPGSFIVRDSHSFRGAYGLAMKVATPPPSVLQQSKKVDLSNELVRHFLIECTQKGVRLKGCPNEPYFGSLTALVCQHSITPLALPCKLILPDRDPVEELNDTAAQTATNSAAELLKQGAACNVWYLGSVELESLTGLQAVQKATTLTLAAAPPPPSTVVHFKVSAQGVTLTDNQRKLFFRRHYAVNTVIFCSLDPQGRKWTKGSGSTAKVFGFVARKSQSETENMCHLFAEHDPEQPASAIVNFVSKVMIGSHKK